MIGPGYVYEGKKYDSAGEVIATLRAENEALKKEFSDQAIVVRRVIGERDDLKSRNERLVKAIKFFNDLMPYGFGECVIEKRDGTKRVLTHYDPEVRNLHNALKTLDIIRPKQDEES